MSDLVNQFKNLDNSLKFKIQSLKKKSMDNNKSKSPFRRLTEKGWLFLITISLITINWSGAKAQQLPLYSSYVYNPMLMSPSFAGNMDQQGQLARLMMAHRYQY
ncbi:MAG: type IX secretion system membrane protein PorP/SprF, partial [Bacteroidia bacterium]